MTQKVSVEQFKKACEELELSGRAENIDIFMAKLETHVDKTMRYNPMNLKEDDVEKIINISKNWVIVSNFIEENIAYYSTKPSIREGRGYRQDGVRLINNEQDEENNVFPQKRIVVQIKKADSSESSEDIYRVDFNLLDDVHPSYSKYLVDNISSIIDSMDKNTFKYKNVDIKKQIDKKDKLFAVISIEDTIYNICEYGTAWLLQTGWNYTFVYVNEELKQFCANNDLDYHFSYQISYDNLYYAIREDNAKIDDTIVLSNSSKSKYDANCLELLELEEMPVYKKIFKSSKKIKTNILNKAKFILELNQIILNKCLEKQKALRIEIILNNLKDKDESIQAKNETNEIQETESI